MIIQSRGSTLTFHFRVIYQPTIWMVSFASLNLFKGATFQEVLPHENGLVGTIY